MIAVEESCRGPASQRWRYAARLFCESGGRTHFVTRQRSISSVCLCGAFCLMISVAMSPKNSLQMFQPATVRRGGANALPVRATGLMPSVERKAHLTQKYSKLMEHVNGMRHLPRHQSSEGGCQRRFVSNCITRLLTLYDKAYMIVKKARAHALPASSTYIVVRSQVGRMGTRRVCPISSR